MGVGGGGFTMKFPSCKLTSKIAWHTICFALRVRRARNCPSISSNGRLPEWNPEQLLALKRQHSGYKRIGGETPTWVTLPSLVKYAWLTVGSIRNSTARNLISPTCINVCECLPLEAPPSPLTQRATLLICGLLWHQKSRVPNTPAPQMFICLPYILRKKTASFKPMSLRLDFDKIVFASLLKTEVFKSKMFILLTWWKW